MSRRRRAASLLSKTLETQAATWAVLAVRVPSLLGGVMTPAERDRMVREKADAAAESAGAVLRTVAQGQRRPGVSPGAALSNWMAIGEAALEPYHARVTANAKRLARSGKPRFGKPRCGKSRSG